MANETTSEATGTVEIFTDGACSGNPGPGGWAYIVRDRATGAEREASGGEPRTTNNRMELLGVIEALRSLEGRHRVLLYSDSEYVVKGLTEWLAGWKRRQWRKSNGKPVLNRELWEQLDALAAAHDVEASWVRGHDDHPENERCDRLAVAAAQAQR